MTCTTDTITITNTVILAPCNEKVEDSISTSSSLSAVERRPFSDNADSTADGRLNNIAGHNVAISRARSTLEEVYNGVQIEQDSLPPKCRVLPAQDADNYERTGLPLLRRVDSETLSSTWSSSTASASMSSAASKPRRTRQPRLHRRIACWWSRNVAVNIPTGKRRDHLALERTFLGYFRTSLSLCITGVLIAQLFRLETSPGATVANAFDPPSSFAASDNSSSSGTSSSDISASSNKSGGDFEKLTCFDIAIPLAATFISSSVVVLLLGAHRFWRQQNAMLRGVVWAGGWEITGIMALVTAVCFLALALVLAVDIDRSGNKH